MALRSVLCARGRCSTATAAISEAACQGCILNARAGRERAADQLYLQQRVYRAGWCRMYGMHRGGARARLHAQRRGRADAKNLLVAVCRAARRGSACSNRTVASGPACGGASRVEAGRTMLWMPQPPCQTAGPLDIATPGPPRLLLPSAAQRRSRKRQPAHCKRTHSRAALVYHGITPAAARSCARCGTCCHGTLLGSKSQRAGIQSPPRSINKMCSSADPFGRYGGVTEQWQT